MQVLACQMNCTYLSDVASLEEWNDALLYLTGCGPEETVKEAQSRLAEQLRTPEED